MKKNVCAYKDIWLLYSIKYINSAQVKNQVKNLTIT